MQLLIVHLEMLQSKGLVLVSVYTSNCKKLGKYINQQEIQIITMTSNKIDCVVKGKTNIVEMNLLHVF